MEILRKLFLVKAKARALFSVEAKARALLSLGAAFFLLAVIAISYYSHGESIYSEDPYAASQLAPVVEGVDRADLHFDELSPVNKRRARMMARIDQGLEPEFGGHFAGMREYRRASTEEREKMRSKVFEDPHVR